jgi:RHS repeat-associated protein
MRAAPRFRLSNGFRSFCTAAAAAVLLCAVFAVSSASGANIGKLVKAAPPTISEEAIGDDTLAPVNVNSPRIDGRSRVGYTLTANPGYWTDSPNFSYQWFRCEYTGGGGPVMNVAMQSSGVSAQVLGEVVGYPVPPDYTCTPIAGAEQSTYTLTTEDVGDLIVVEVTGSNSFGSETARSSFAGSVKPPETVLYLNGVPWTEWYSARPGERIKVTATYGGAPEGIQSVQWVECYTRWDGTDNQRCAPANTGDTYVVPDGVYWGDARVVTAHGVWRETAVFSTVSLGYGGASAWSMPGPDEQGGPPPTTEPPTTCPAALPVNCATGEFWHSFDDLEVPGRGVALHLARTYNSLNASTNGPLGYGWTMSYSMSLSTNVVGDVTIHEGSGASVHFFEQPGNSYEAPSWVSASLTRNSDGSYTLTDTRRLIDYRFSSEGRLLGESDRSGYTTTLAYHDGLLETVTDPSGRKLRFSYDHAKRIAKVTDPAGRSVAFAYDANGNLRSAADVGGGVTTFTYDSKHRLLTMTDPRGGKTTNVYDDRGRVTRQTDPLHRVTKFAYSGNPASDAGSTTTITNPLGVSTVHTYADMMLISVTRAAGTAKAHTWHYNYDPSSLGIASVTDPAGHSTAYLYDDEGNITLIVDPLGRATTLDYNSLHEPVSVTDPAGTTANYNYDTAGNLTRFSRPLVSTGEDSTVRLLYGDTTHPGDVTGIIDPDGNQWSFAYDAQGDVTSSSDPLGDTTRMTYDELGRPVSVISPRGNEAGANAGAFTTKLSYDAFGRVVKVVDPLGHVTSKRYDASGNLVKTIDPNGNATTSSYDLDNELTGIRRADGTSLSYGYDAAGNQIKQRDAKGRVTSYAYDALGELVSETDPLGRTTHYGYDAAGNRTSVTDPRGAVVSYGFDAAKELTTIDYSNGSPGVSIDYTPDGQRASMTDATGTNSYDYDSLNRLVSQTNGAGQSVGHDYDLAGHLTAITYPNGQAISRSYDAAGRLASVSDWLGNTTSFSRDADGNVTGESSPNGVTATTSFDATDAISSIADKGPAGVLARFNYTRDANGQVTSSSSTGASSDKTTYTYSPLNQLQGVNDAAFSFDPVGDLTRLPDGTSLSYDSAGELTATKGPSGSETFSYDQAGDRTAETGAGHRHTSPSRCSGLSRSPSGRASGRHPQALRQRDHCRGRAGGEKRHRHPKATYTYDTVHQLVKAKVGGVATTYAYSGDGLRASETTDAGTKQFAWDTSSELPLLLTDGETSYIYDDAGTPIEQIASDDTTLYFQHDQLDSTRFLTDKDGMVAASFSYDSYGTLTSKKGEADTPLRWNGQYQDETGLYYLRARYYDPQTAQFLTRDPLEPLTQEPYGYVYGNPLNWADPLGLGCSWTSPWDCIGEGASDWWTGVQLIGGDLVEGIDEHARGISETTGALAAFATVIPGLQEAVPILGAISAVTGAIAAEHDVSSGQTLLAAVDTLGAALSAEGATLFVGEALLGEAANAALEAGQLATSTVSEADVAAATERLGQLLDTVGGSVSAFSALVVCM